MLLSICYCKCKCVLVTVNANSNSNVNVNVYLTLKIITPLEKKVLNSYRIYIKPTPLFNTVSWKKFNRGRYFVNINGSRGLGLVLWKFGIPKGPPDPKEAKRMTYPTPRSGPYYYKRLRANQPPLENFPLITKSIKTTNGSACNAPKLPVFPLCK